MIDMRDKTTYSWNAVANYRTATVADNSNRQSYSAGQEAIRNPHNKTCSKSEAATLLKGRLSASN